MLVPKQNNFQDELRLRQNITKVIEKILVSTLIEKTFL